MMVALAQLHVVDERYVNPGQVWCFGSMFVTEKEQFELAIYLFSNVSYKRSLLVALPVRLIISSRLKMTTWISVGN